MKIKEMYLDAGDGFTVHLLAIHDHMLIKLIKDKKYVTSTISKELTCDEIFNKVSSMIAEEILKQLEEIIDNAKSTK